MIQPSADELTKYAKMLKMGVPEPAVRGKMATDGFDDDMYDKYLNPDTAITLNQQPDEDEADDEQKNAEVDILNPDQPESNIVQPEQEQKQPSGYFASQNYVPPADSGMLITIILAHIYIYTVRHISCIMYLVSYRQN